MTINEKRIKVAERCGWREAFPRHPDLGKERGGILLPYTYENLHTKQRVQIIPDYPSSLDAMHEAEKMLNEKERYKYSAILHALSYPNSTHDKWFFYVTASPSLMRFEAFGIATGLWKEGE